MTHHHARLIVVAVAAVSFSTPITAQQEPTSPPTVETLVETLGGNVSQKNEQGEVVEVYLSRTRVTDADLPHLAGSHALQLLDLSRTRITGPGLAHLAGLPVLETLGLWDTQIADEGLAHLAKFPALEDLNLDNTQITDAGLAHLAGLAALETLDLTDTQVTDAGVAELQKALPNCGIVLQAPILDPIFIPPFPLQ
jgi:Leucine-rich repeat (LRR) protein